MYTLTGTQTFGVYLSIFMECIYACSSFMNNVFVFIVSLNVNRKNSQDWKKDKIKYKNDDIIGIRMWRVSLYMSVNIENIQNLMLFIHLEF